MSRLSGRRVVITGAATGIGAAMVALFLDEDAEVIGVDRHAERLGALATRTPGITGVVADLATPEGVDRAVAAAGDRVDVLCNNAGIIDPMAPVDEASEEDWDRVLALNLTAVFRLCRRALPVMLAGGGGSIVNTASVGGLRAGRAGVAYTASKFGVVGLSQNIAVTHGHRGIRCNAICPGSVRTSIEEGVELSPWGTRVGTRDRDKPEPASPEQIAAVAVFLATDAASRLNGAAIPVDGGWIAY